MSRGSGTEVGVLLVRGVVRRGLCWLRNAYISILKGLGKLRLDAFVAVSGHAQMTRTRLDGQNRVGTVDLW